MESSPDKKIIYGFALKGAGKLLYRLKNLDCCYLVYPNNLECYLDMLIHDQPKYILGLGLCSNPNQDKIQLETICSNGFPNDFIDSKQHPNMEHAKSIDNSSGNQASWKIGQLISRGKLDSQYTFLRIPKTMKPWVASSIIDEALLNVLNQAL